MPWWLLQGERKLLPEKSSVDTRTNRSKLITDKFRLKMERGVRNVKVQEGLGETPHESWVQGYPTVLT